MKNSKWKPHLAVSFGLVFELLLFLTDSARKADGVSRNDDTFVPARLARQVRT